MIKTAEYLLSLIKEVDNPRSDATLVLAVEHENVDSVLPGNLLWRWSQCTKLSFEHGKGQNPGVLS